MRPAALALTVILASYGLIASLLTLATLLIAPRLIPRMRLGSEEWLALRLVPSLGAAIVTLLLVVPAYLRNEPVHERETPGPLLIALATVTVISLAAAAFRFLRALRATRVLERRTPIAATLPNELHCPVHVIVSEQPLVGVIGWRRPRILIAGQVVQACTRTELEYVLAHEMAHVRARDNLKRWLTIASPDLLCWTRAGRDLSSAWELACERAADERATAGAQEGRLHLASALVKVSRLAGGQGTGFAAAGVPLIGFWSVEERVRCLLAPRAALRRGPRLRVCVALLLLAVVTATLLLHSPVHEAVEALVHLGA